MRIDPSTGSVITSDNYYDNYCHNCDCELNDDSYPWCEHCEEYIGIVVNNYPDLNSQKKIQQPDSNSNEQMSIPKVSISNNIIEIIFWTIFWFVIPLVISLMIAAQS